MANCNNMLVSSLSLDHLLFTWANLYIIVCVKVYYNMQLGKFDHSEGFCEIFILFSTHLHPHLSHSLDLIIIQLILWQMVNLLIQVYGIQQVSLFITHDEFILVVHMYCYCYCINITSGIYIFSLVKVCTLFYNQKPSHYLQMTSSYNMKSFPTNNDL